MAFCGKCGTNVPEGIKFCPTCGTPVAAPAQPEQPAPAAAPAQPKTDYAEKLQNLNNTADTTADYDQADITANKGMAVLAYLGILVLIPLFAAKNSKFARFHTNQGLVLALCEIAYAIVSSILSWLLLAISWRLYFVSSLFSLLGALFLVPAILGIINAANGKAKELPILGKIKLLK